MEVINGGAVSSSTFSEGDAGSVKVKAGELRIDGRGSPLFTGIESLAYKGASGLVGDIEIAAESILLSNGGAVSIAHYGNIPDSVLEGFTPGHLRIDAGTLHLQSGSEVSALSAGNAPASSILVHIRDRLTVEGSSQITTSATGTGDGGSITIDPALTILQDGLITTSSAAGDGGDISLRSDVLILRTGFIQANAAEGAKGGNIFIDTRAIIAEGGNLQVGGEVRQEFVAGSGVNVIQAAAPGGEQGTISITAPEVDITGSLMNLQVGWAEGLSLASDPCFTASGESGSSLFLGGRGGVALSPDQPMEVSFGRDRLDELMLSEEPDN
jgi:hypothetical protein